MCSHHIVFLAGGSNAIDLLDGVEEDWQLPLAGETQNAATYKGSQAAGADHKPAVDV
jgi:hypothetical protein